ncbi:hypothetical protein ACE1ET_13005 [Saccharicrinis sp. FJH62]|uniref:hypothetical protein n=1 Tax=Saccharicrinis sp. FJH62 TaxID=3344657 RepID=UPI0035D454AB
MQITYEQLQQIYNRKGYNFFDRGSYNLNIFGIRSDNPLVDEFNDFIGLAYRDVSRNKIVHLFNATTKPGLYWLKQKTGSVNGTAILIPGQYKSCWTLGFHKGYQALTQKAIGVFNIWRDNDMDGDLDTSGQVFSDVTGLNLHTTSFKNDVEKVGAYSAGCQVIQDDLDFNIFLAVVIKSSMIYGSVFSYTLFELNDF